ncbi:HAD family hydrolase [Ornithinibacillus xuwenensis]|uniref:HAD family hydrolase n=1 Tax=Ornithinibacillus xuwenensis TaxID=3144668 RepID=A0ABU9XCZ8_9BACI
MIEAVFFDLYETLITEWENNQKKATYSIQELGLEEAVYKREWALRRNKRMDGTYPDHQSVLIDIMASQRLEVDQKTIEAIHQNRVRAKLVPFQNIDIAIIDMLMTLRRLRIRIGLISNCAPEEVEGWNTSMLAELFDDVVFSYEMRLSKPNPEIYEKACKNLNVSATNSIFIGDGGFNELEGATNSGMKAYHATWFLPKHLHDNITGYSKLYHPAQILEVVKQRNI